MKRYNHATEIKYLLAWLTDEMKLPQPTQLDYLNERITTLGKQHGKPLPTMAQLKVKDRQRAFNTTAHRQTLVAPVYTSTLRPAGTFCLFADRHDLPSNDGALYSGYDWTLRQAIENPGVVKRAISRINEGLDIKLYVTGLTPALTEFISQINALRQDLLDRGLAAGNLVLLHWDRDTRTYFDQVIF